LAAPACAAASRARSTMPWVMPSSCTVAPASVVSCLAASGVRAGRVR
jgi:hypothetical protein